MSKFCNSCTWWSGEIFTRPGQSFGICSHPVGSTCMLQDSQAKINETNVVYTSSSFGCVYCERKQKLIIDITKTIEHAKQKSQHRN